MKKYLPILCVAILAAAVAFAAQPAKPRVVDSVAAPVPVLAAEIATPAPVPLVVPPTTPTTPITPTVVETETVTVAPAPAGTPVAPPLPVGPKGARTATGSAPASTGVMLNFQNASLNDVLTYLSEAAGFVIVQEAPVTGTVNIVSRQSLSPEEAVDLLNTVLIDKGYAAIRNGRILKIINRRDAQKRDIPVQQGSNPELIPRKDNVVIQILPLRYGEAAKLVENLRPLLADTATISANEGSNAIILTDTQSNIHRMAQIIHALDTSVSALSTITVIPLKYADSKEVAQIITQLFQPVETGPAGQGGKGGGGGRRGGFPGFGFPGMAQPAGGGSDARAAAARVVAVADEQSNSVIVSASEDTIPVIRSMIEQIDMSSTDITDTRIFRLLNADATELAGTINSLFGSTAGTLSAGANRGGGNQQGGNNNQRRQGAPAAPAAGGAAGQSERALLQSQVVAVGDPRTNSLLVTASADSMAKVSEVVTRLDATGAKRQHVYYHQLQNGDPSTIADVLRGMLGQGTNNNSAVSVLQNRSVTGSTLNTNLSGTGSGSGSGNNGRSNR
jgi:type II secretory pathway component GspD/PulD (secretin)